MDVSNDVLRDLTEDEDRGLGDDAARRRDGDNVAVGDVSQRKLANPVPAVTELRADPAPQDARLARARAGEHTFIHAYTHTHTHTHTHTERSHARRTQIGILYLHLPTGERSGIPLDGRRGWPTTGVPAILQPTPTTVVSRNPTAKPAAS